MSRRASELNWDRLRREAAEEYERSGQARRRRALGSQATAEAEELAWWAKHRPDAAPVAIGVQDADAVRAAALVADQAVYVYHGQILLAKLEPSTIWDCIPVDRGMRLQTILMSRSAGHYVAGPSWEPGEWTFCGRGHPGE